MKTITGSRWIELTRKRESVKLFNRAWGKWFYGIPYQYFKHSIAIGIGEDDHIEMFSPKELMEE